jgi:hypothetical protein
MPVPDQYAGRQQLRACGKTVGDHPRWTCICIHDTVSWLMAILSMLAICEMQACFRRLFTLPRNSASTGNSQQQQHAVWQQPQTAHIMGKGHTSDAQHGRCVRPTIPPLDHTHSNKGGPRIRASLRRFHEQASSCPAFLPQRAEAATVLAPNQNAIRHITLPTAHVPIIARHT